MISDLSGANAPHPVSDQALADDVVIARAAPIGPLFLATLGWLLAFIAVMGMRWPLEGAGPTETGPHLMRFAPLPDEPLISALGRGFVNAGIYVILIFGAALLLAGWVRHPRGVMRWLAIISFLGLMYVAGMALYTGPMLAVCGFTVMLFSALVGWSASLELNERKKKNVLLEANLLEAKETNDYATHSPA